MSLETFGESIINNLFQIYSRYVCKNLLYLIHMQNTLSLIYHRNREASYSREVSRVQKTNGKIGGKVCVTNGGPKSLQ